MTCPCPPCKIDEELFGAGDTEPAPPRESSTFLWHGKDCGPNRWRECYECENGVMSHDCDAYAIGDKQRWICGWCLGWPRFAQQDEEEKMASVREFYETVKAIAKAHDRKSFVASVQVHGTADGGIYLQWEGYVEGAQWVTGPSAPHVVESLRKVVRGEELTTELDVADLGTPPEPRAA